MSKLRSKNWFLILTLGLSLAVMYGCKEEGAAPSASDAVEAVEAAEEAVAPAVKAAGEAEHEAAHEEHDESAGH